MSKSNETKRARQPVAEKMRELVKEAAGEWSPEQREKFDSMEKELNSLSQKAADQERDEKAASLADAISAGVDERRHAEQKAAQTKNIITTEMRHNALRAWCFGDRPAAMKDEWREHAKACGVDVHQREIEFNLLPQAPRDQEELRRVINENLTYRATTAQSLTAAMGGNLVADDVSLAGTLESALLAHGGQRNVSRVIRTANGADLPIPQTDDTTEKATLLTEASTVTIASLDFSKTTLGAYKFASYVVASSELLEDSAIDVASYVGSAMGERVARGTNDYFTTGTGSSQPKGAVHGAVATVTGSTSGDVSYAKLVDLLHSVDPAYRASPNFAFQMSDGLLSEVRALVDSQGNPIWAISARDGIEGTQLLGHRININQSMTSSSTNDTTKIIVAGDFSKHIIRDVASVRLRRLDERLALSDEVAWTCFSRHDAAILFSTSATASAPVVALRTT